MNFRKQEKYLQAKKRTYLQHQQIERYTEKKRERGMEYENDNIQNSSRFGFSFHYKFTLAYRYTTTSTERIQFY